MRGQLSLNHPEMQVAVQDNIHFRMLAQEVVSMRKCRIRDFAGEISDLLYVFYRQDDNISVVTSKPECSIFRLIQVSFERIRKYKFRRFKIFTLAYPPLTIDLAFLKNR